VAALDGAPVDIDPRTVLERQTAALSALGLEARAAFEFELYLVSPDGAGVTTERDCYGFALPEQVERFIDGVMRLAEAGIGVEAAESEWGVAQLEFTLTPRGVLEAADQAVWFKAAAKAIAHELGVVATFMPKLDPAEPGSGLHVNQSLWDASGRNVFAQPVASSAGGASTTSRDRYLSGLLATAADFFLLAAPSVNAYKRRVPGAFAPTTVTWSQGSRTAAVRAMFDRGEDESRVPTPTPTWRWPPASPAGSSA
jgi:glutamine synthetase